MQASDGGSAVPFGRVLGNRSGRDLPRAVLHCLDIAPRVGWAAHGDGRGAAWRPDTDEIGCSPEWELLSAGAQPGEALIVPAALLVEACKGGVGASPAGAAPRF